MIESKAPSTEVEFSQFATRYLLFHASRGGSQRKLVFRGFQDPASREAAESRLIDDGFQNIEIHGYGKIHTRIDEGVVELETIAGHESEICMAREIIEDNTEWSVLVKD